MPAKTVIVPRQTRIRKRCALGCVAGPASAQSSVLGRCACSSGRPTRRAGKGSWDREAEVKLGRPRES